MTVAHKRTSSAHSSDMVARWRLRCPALEEQLEDATRAHSALQKQYGELSLDYRHCLDRLWKQNAGLSTRRDR